MYFVWIVNGNYLVRKYQSINVLKLQIHTNNELLQIHTNKKINHKS